MTKDDLDRAIEVAGESVYGGFAEKDSFEYLLACAVLELKKQLNAIEEKK
jgi:hypothetical protein